MFPLTWLLRNLGGIVWWVEPGRGPEMSGGGRAWNGGRGRGQSQVAPTAPDRTRNSSRVEAGETERDTYRDRELATHSQKEEGVHTLGYGAPSKYTQWARVSNAVNQAHLCRLLYPCLCSQPPLSAASCPQPPNLPLLPTEFEEGLLDRCPAPGTHPALVEGRRSSVKVEAEASRQ